MYQGQAQTDVSSRSELLSSLKVYLNNKNRLQPIIGLGSITECVKVGAHKRETMYLCEVCVCRLGKADMRNHIMGSLHRYNYIKACYPFLVHEWEENSDLSELAWPLMAIAKTVEGKEGAGDVQLLEVDDAVYQKMATDCEIEAITTMNFLKDSKCEPENDSGNASVQLEHNSIQSVKNILLDHHRQKWSEKSLTDTDILQISPQTSEQSYMPPPLMQSSVAPTKLESLFKSTSESQLHDTRMSPETCALPGVNKSFLDGYTESKPLIGLFCVVECRSKDGHTHIFLCQCCRIRSNKNDIIDHLTSSSHLINYLMEKHPEQLDVVTADAQDNGELIQSLARRVEQEEGRGELKVITIPESLSILMNGKSYHWCIKMLFNGWTWTNVQKNKLKVKGPRMNKTSVESLPEKRTVVLSKSATRKKRRRKMKKAGNTVFKVSLPLTEGSVLLERMPFSEYSPTVSHSATSDLIPLPEDCELDCDTASLSLNNTEKTAVRTISQHQQDLYSYADSEFMEMERIFTGTKYENVDSNFSIN
ncbi:uncharacterized protein LOC115051107 [Echeneis naucrates]|uniref:uncharacterized protein LOC115051107 n=1 Tax=Echeneis naucrates TaxID=173247 RepID=UPI0011133293|nr:uncharacterized protein LOC115051107 [Echeneis naucrates]XP_029370268.1 uncharacterized protein LOC115051107 [Echeneis naucrates]